MAWFLLIFSISRTTIGPSFRHKKILALTLDLVNPFICPSARSYKLPVSIIFGVLIIIPMNLGLCY